MFMAAAVDKPPQCARCKAEEGKGRDCETCALKGKKGWAFIPLSMAEVATVVQEKADDQWLWISPNRQCGKVATTPKPAKGREMGLHATVLLELPGDWRTADDVQPLREAFDAALASDIDKSLTVRNLFVRKVQRIADEDVWCVGVEFASRFLRRIRDEFTKNLDPAQRKKHCPYEGEGHASLVYFHGEYRQSVQNAMAAARTEVERCVVPFERIIYQDASSEPIIIGS